MVSLNLILLILILPPIVLMSAIVNKKLQKLLLFVVAGMVAAFLSGQINSVIAEYSGQSMLDITIHYTPVVEELLKAFPVMLCLFIFKPQKKDVVEYAVCTGIGFAFFENAWAFSQSVSSSPAFEDVLFALSRGFGASMVHCLCTVILVYGTYSCMKIKKLLLTGPFALFSLVCLFHSSFNMFISSSLVWAPFILTIGAYVGILGYLHYKRRKK